VQHASTVYAHNRQAVLLGDARIFHSTKPVASWHVGFQSCGLQNLGIAGILGIMPDMDKLRQRLIDRQTVIDQTIDRWWFGPTAWVMVRGGHFEHLT